jgi:hypothetical protein
VRSLVIALSIALPSAGAISVQAASLDNLDQIAKSEVCPADLHPYRDIPLSEACPEHLLNAISPDQMIQCRDDWLKDDARIARYNRFIQRCSSKPGTTAESLGKTGLRGRTTVWKQQGSRPSKILSYPPSEGTSVAKGDEERLPSTSIQPASAKPSCMDACMVEPKARSTGTDPGSPARKALCLFTCGITQ